jgi:thiamine-phosphate pyrophosphorylase
MTWRRRVELPPLYLITDRNIPGLVLIEALEAALKGGVKLVQLREKDLPPRELEKLARQALELTHRYDARLLLNDNPGLAAEIGADGVQLGVHSTDIASAREIVGVRALIGYSAHSCREVLSAAAQGADFVTFSPIYATASKAAYGPPQGLPALVEVCRKSLLPVYALGGIAAERISEVLHAGASGIALITAVLAAPDPQKAARQILQQIKLNAGES